MAWERHLIIALVAMVIYQWTQVQPKITWTPAPEMTYDSCPSSTKEKTLFFGATSMLGKYIVESYISANPEICLINYGRSKCKKCHVNIKGDLRDTRHVHRVLDAFDITTVITSVKPPLLGIHYRDYVELNLLSMVELVRAAKAKGVSHFLYVSSIAASSHYIAHHNASESDPQPLYTDYEAPYDVSKRVAEDVILAEHEEGKFNTVSIRTSGIYGGTGDPYFYYRFPILLSFGCPVIDANYAANIGDALYAVDRKMKKQPSVGGQFYYYTGESTPETQLAQYAADATGKPVLEIPFWMLEIFLETWNYFRFDWNVYNLHDLLRMAVVPQTFDQSKFHATFPEFKAKYTLRDAINIMYGKGAN